MVTLFLRQGENGKQVLLSFPATTLTEIADVAATLETLKSRSKTVTIQGAASEVMNLGLYLSGVDGQWYAITTDPQPKMSESEQMQEMQL